MAKKRKKLHDNIVTIGAGTGVGAGAGALSSIPHARAVRKKSNQIAQGVYDRKMHQAAAHNRKGFYLRATASHRPTQIKMLQNLPGGRKIYKTHKPSSVKDHAWRKTRYDQARIELFNRRARSESGAKKWAKYIKGLGIKRAKALPKKYAIAGAAVGAAATGAAIAANKDDKPIGRWITVRGRPIFLKGKKYLPSAAGAAVGAMIGKAASKAVDKRIIKIRDKKIASVGRGIRKKHMYRNFKAANRLADLSANKIARIAYKHARVAKPVVIAAGAAAGAAAVYGLMKQPYRIRKRQRNE